MTLNLRARLGALWIYAASMLALGVPSLTHAQAGPPFLTNDPGTPGNANWEINIAAAPTVTRPATSWQLPLLDMNFGVGDRIQLTYEVPYLFNSEEGSSQSGWSNAYPGVKWRFLDQGEGGWQASIFPQFETGGSSRAVLTGIAAPGPRYLLPIEIAKSFATMNFDVEYGQYFPQHGPRERIMGLVVGRPVTKKLELDAELYDDRATDALPHETMLDLGGRYTLRPGLIGLFMAGRSLDGTADGNAELTGYFGIQILLSDYGLKRNDAGQ